MREEVIRTIATSTREKPEDGSHGGWKIDPGQENRTDENSNMLLTGAPQENDLESCTFELRVATIL